jgi:F-type H+-transporting ATPase subunit epsilon
MAEANAMHVRLVTPDKIFLDGYADAVSLPGRSGYLEALYGHAPLLTELGAGEVALHGGEFDGRRYFVAWGFAEVLPDRVTILAESALEPQEISVPDAQAELERGQRLWSEAGEDGARYQEANAVIHEAEERLNAAQGSGHNQ